MKKTLITIWFILWCCIGITLGITLAMALLPNFIDGMQYLRVAAW